MRVKTILAQAGLLIVFLCGWQFLPKIPALAAYSHVFDPFFVSSPVLVATRLYDLLTGQNGTFPIWPYILPTVTASVIGLLLGTGVGAAFGLILSNSPFLSQVFQPFLVAINSIPRIALVPIIVVIVGPTFQSSVALAFAVVFFVVFYNAYEGGRAILPNQIHSAKLLGATPLQIVVLIRLNYVIAWTMAALPTATSFAIITVVTGELLTGYGGLGYLVSAAQSTADATLSFAVAIVMAVLGLTVVGLTSVVRRRVLHWWVSEREL